MASSTASSTLNGSVTTEDSTDESAQLSRESSPEIAKKSKHGKVSSVSRLRAQKYKHVFTIHDRSQPSCLTYQDVEATPNFWGFRNLLVLMLIVSNLRLVIENFKKYGVLVSFTSSVRTTVFLECLSSPSPSTDMRLA
jgi:diacylglycerol O-acyltransferase-1